jgi:sialidase-1
LGGILADKTDECEVVQLEDESLYLTMRNYNENYRRAYSLSNDGGLTWSEVAEDPNLIDPICQASIVRFTDTKTYEKNRILFSNPASKKREKLTVRMSYDECKTWSFSKLLNRGPSGYSDLTITPDMNVCCLYERGDRYYFQGITFAKFNLEWLTDSRDFLYSEEDKGLYQSFFF